jgi:hypothetical protein
MISGEEFGVSSLTNSILDRFIELSLWGEMTAWEVVILLGKIVLSASSGCPCPGTAACEDGKYTPCGSVDIVPLRCH